MVRYKSGGEKQGSCQPEKRGSDGQRRWSWCEKWGTQLCVSASSVHETPEPVVQYWVLYCSHFILNLNLFQWTNWKSPDKMIILTSWQSWSKSLPCWTQSSSSSAHLITPSSRPCCNVLGVPGPQPPEVLLNVLLLLWSLAFCYSTNVIQRSSVHIGSAAPHCLQSVLQPEGDLCSRSTNLHCLKQEETHIRTELRTAMLLGDDSLCTDAV